MGKGMIIPRALASRTGIIFLHSLGKQRRKQGQHEARVAHKGKSDFFRALPFTCDFALQACLAFSSVCLNYAKNYACSAS